MTIEIDITVESAAWSAIADLDGIVRRSVDAVAALTDAGAGDGAELSVLLCDDAAIRALNRDWRGKDKATNVLSFPSAAPADVPGPRLLGDIAVAYETTAREASEEDKTIEAHLAHLIVHGMLHLLDHDHENDTDAARMEAFETRILARLGVADPYAGTEPEAAAR